MKTAVVLALAAFTLATVQAQTLVKPTVYVWQWQHPGAWHQSAGPG